MSKAVKKVFKKVKKFVSKVGKFVKKHALAIVAVAATVFTAGAALGFIGVGAATGGAAAGGLTFGAGAGVGGMAGVTSAYSALGSAAAGALGFGETAAAATVTETTAGGIANASWGGTGALAPVVPAAPAAATKGLLGMTMGETLQAGGIALSAGSAWAGHSAQADAEKERLAEEEQARRDRYFYDTNSRLKAIQAPTYQQINAPVLQRPAAPTNPNTPGVNRNLTTGTTTLGAEARRQYGV
jgi:hypothetical protein